MSQENVELVRQIIERLNRRDIGGALADAAHDDFVADFSNSIGPSPGAHRGRQQVSQFFWSFVELWEEVRWEPQELIDVDESRVIAVNRVYMRGRDGIAANTRMAQVWTFSGRKAISVRMHQSKADALEAVGLRE